MAFCNVTCLNNVGSLPQDNTVQNGLPIQWISSGRPEIIGDEGCDEEDDCSESHGNKNIPITQGMYFGAADDGNESRSSARRVQCPYAL